MLPGSPEECSMGVSEFDPRVRPWYVAASSGPKDIILILDTSGSMGNYGRLGIVKDAAKRVINTLGVSDFFSVIEFNSVAKHVGISGGEDSQVLMQRANDENKKRIIGSIDNLGASGGTNYGKGFQLAFKTFKASDAEEKTSGCHKAILFLTDGIMRDDKLQFLRLLREEFLEYNDDDRPKLFTYSFGGESNGSVPKTIACEHGGIWASIGDGGDLAKSMGAYYKYFAYGLSGKDNDEFFAWVSPYSYSTTGELGTTASAPVYDRSVDPPVLAGVVGMDFSFAAMERALGDEGKKSKNVVLESIVERSIAVCPKLDLSSCQLQSLREYGSGDDSNEAALCLDILNDDGNSCGFIKPLKSPLCSEQGVSYPSEIWQNDLNDGRSYEEKVCCHVGADPRLPDYDARTDDELGDLICLEKSNAGMIIGIIVGSVVGFLILVFFGMKYMKRKSNSTPSDFGNKEGASTLSPQPKTNHNHANPAIESDIVVMPPPTAPTYE